MAGSRRRSSGPRGGSSSDGPIAKKLPLHLVYNVAALAVLYAVFGGFLYVHFPASINLITPWFGSRLPARGPLYYHRHRMLIEQGIFQRLVADQAERMAGAGDQTSTQQKAAIPSKLRPKRVIKEPVTPPAPVVTPRPRASVGRAAAQQAAQLSNEADRLFRSGRYQDAYNKYLESTRLSPNNAHPFHYMALASHYLGHRHNIIPNFRMACELNPSSEAMWHDLGLAYNMNDRRNIEGLYAYQRAHEIDPTSTRALVGVGMMLNFQNRHAEARGYLKKVFSLPHSEADTHRAYNQMGESYRKTLFGAQKAAEFYAKDPIDSQGNVLWVLQYREDVSKADALDMARAYGRKMVQENPPFQSWPAANNWRPGNKLRIGFFSHEFFYHAVALFTIAAVEDLDRSKFDVVCFSDSLKFDDMTVRFQRACNEWIGVNDVDAASTANKIRNSNIHILVELQGHTANRMATMARKPAPIMVDYIGHPGTTGLPGMDYRITDPWADPPGMTELHYTEALWRLPSGFNCFTPRHSSSELPLSPPPIKKNGFLTVGTFSNIAKLSRSTLRLFAKVVLSIPNSKLLLKDAALDDPFNRDKLLAFMQDHGVDEDRLIIAGYVEDSGKNMLQYNKMDIALDPTPFNGVTTTADALFMGLPVVTLAGDLHVSRVCTSMVTRLGHPEWAAETKDEYVEVVQRLASDVEGLEHLRLSLRDKFLASPLVDRTLYVKELGDAFSQMWTKYRGK